MPTKELVDAVMAKLPAITERVGHSEIYGVDVLEASDPTRLIIAKYLKAHSDNQQAALIGIEGTLRWRREFNPRSAAFEEKHADQYDGLGMITKLSDGEIIVWNIYGAAAHNPKALFEPLDAFLRWRIGLQERSVHALDLPSYRGDGLDDPKLAQQVHDYDSVSFFRMDPSVKAGTKAAIDLLTKHYPETMKRKFFVNVPAVMGWVFSAMRLFLSKETVAKFTIVSYGNQLVHEIGHADEIPTEYGGNSPRHIKDMAQSYESEKTAPSTDKNADALGKSAAATIDEIKAAGLHANLPPAEKGSTGVVIQQEDETDKA
ncbi:Non-classical phosphatidylinositol transfer protein (PITP) [Cystobasidiomycetes sp. EMM_F5]